MRGTHTIARRLAGLFTAYPPALTPGLATIPHDEGWHLGRVGRLESHVVAVVLHCIHRSLPQKAAAFVEPNRSRIGGENHQDVRRSNRQARVQLFHESGANTSPRPPGVGVEAVKFRFPSLAVEVQKPSDHAFLFGDEELRSTGCQASIDAAGHNRR